MIGVAEGATSFVCLFDLILYVPSTIFQLNRDGSSWVEPVLSKDNCDYLNRYTSVLLKDHNAVTPVRLKPVASLSRVKHSTTVLPKVQLVEMGHITSIFWLYKYTVTPV